MSDTPTVPPVHTPEPFEPRQFTAPEAAVACLVELYHRNVAFLRDALDRVDGADDPAEPMPRFRAFYPALSISTTESRPLDVRRAYGHLASPGAYSTTITRPDLFASYLTNQLTRLIETHQVPVTVAESNTPIPIHFAVRPGQRVDPAAIAALGRPILDFFDVPDLSGTDDAIVNGTIDLEPDHMAPLAPFTAPRIDYSLQRLAHYTATDPEHFQNYVLFTNYQFYVEEFRSYAYDLMRDGDSGFTGFVEPGNVVIAAGDAPPELAPTQLPQMPAWHLTKPGNSGVTIVNIGVGPANAKTITDHIAVLRPDVWLMLGHCAGLRSTQRLGDYVLAHAYVREDHVLDEDLPTWIPIPPLAEVQVALEQAVAETTGLSGYELKRVMRTGTVASTDNRNWELQDPRGPIRRLSQSRAVALDMESAAIAANGFRFRVPYGTLLCVSDRPLHGELKLPGMATDFYRTQVHQHLRIGLLAISKLAEMQRDRLHSRKLRSFTETAFQ